MRAVVATAPGGPEVLEVVELEAPTPGRGEVRVRVHGAAVNPADVLLRSGAIPLPPSVLPFVPGMDLAGIVDRIGAGTDTALRVGDRVMGLTVPIRPGGAYAELVVVPESWLVTVPDSVTLHEAATVPMNGLTALQAIEVLELQAGDVVAVTGSAGAFGGYLIQLARLAGIHTIADAGPDDEELIRSLEATHVVPRGDGFAGAVRALVPDGAHAVADGALIGPAVLPAVRDGGIYGGLRGEHGPGTMTMPGAPRGIRYLDWEVAHARGDQVKLRTLRDALGVGSLTPRVAEVVPPEQAARVHADFERGGTRGRFVLDFTA